MILADMNLAGWRASALARRLNISLATARQLKNGSMTLDQVEIRIIDNKIDEPINEKENSDVKFSGD